MLIYLALIELQPPLYLIKDKDGIKKLLKGRLSERNLGVFGAQLEKL